MINWFARCASSRREHDRLWAPEREVQPDGLSRFQHRAEAAVAAAGFPLSERQVLPLRGGPPDELYVTGLVGAFRGQIYLYRDGVELRAGGEELRVEDWDVKYPDEMIQRLVVRLAELRV